MYMHHFRPYRVCIFSVVHIALDNRIYYREALSLKNAGYKVSLIAVHDKKELRNDIEIIPLPRLRRALRPLLWFRILYLAIRTKADIYQFCDPELLFISPILRILTGRPIIYDVLESTADFIDIKDDIPYVLRRFFSSFFGWFEPTLSNLQNGLIFADDEIAKTFQKLKLPKITLYNFPERSFLENAIQETKNINDHKPIVLYLGGIKRARGTTLMLDAFELVLKRVLDATLLLVGPFAPHSLEKEIRKEIEYRNLNNSVIITGAVPFSEVGKYFKQASVGWIPFQPIAKYQKNIPTKLFEYMAYAVPVVSSNLLSIQPFISDGQTGLLVPADNPAAHAEAIIDLLQNPAKAAKIGINGQEMVMEHYQWSLMEARLLHLYKELLSIN